MIYIISISLIKKCITARSKMPQGEEIILTQLILKYFNYFLELIIKNS